MDVGTTNVGCSQFEYVSLIFLTV